MSESVVIRPAEASDAAVLAGLGARLFDEAFGAANRPEDMAAYLTTAFGERQQAAELADSSNRVWLAEAPGAGAVGYAHLRLGPTPPGVPGRQPAELARLYVDRRWHGGGVARALMDACEEGARGWGADALWLGVWERNPRAIAFYRKCGFERVGTQSFQLGGDLQTDHVMAKMIRAP